MKILGILKTWLTARGLKILLLNKEVILPNGVSIGVVAAIRREMSQDKIWMVIDNLGQESMIPIEQIVSVANKVILADDLLSTEPSANKSLVCLEM
ncbi:MAG: hypothetical protein SU899_02460 [Chloroflexota bacterium]|nr:hypothetical protein [Chloroflexota bacterium]